MIVKRILDKGGATLIEWVEGDVIQRAIVPSADVNADGVCAYPERGIPYGVDWADYIDELPVTPADIEEALRNAGIWTAQDLLQRPNEAHGAITAACGSILRDLIRQFRHTDGGSQ